MAPTPEEFIPSEDVAAGERVVISGMSGLFPLSHHVKELSEHLYSKTNTVTKTPRWKYNHPEVANHTGIVPGLEHFDAQFFKVHFRLGNSMDSMSRKILEQAYQAIYDAGVSPEHLNGKKVGVYTGTCFSETEKACFYVASSRTGFGIAGCSKTMFANRVSYWLNAKGPSMSIDEACCSSLAALEHAYTDISRGECEAAIVAGANLCLHPQSSVHYGRIMTLCMDGKTKSFDEHADGLAKSEAINVLFLQKAKNAKRIYAEVLHAKNEFRGFLQGETGPKYGFYRDPMNMAQFIKEFYDEAGVSPKQVEYVEAFGSAVPEADKAELEAIEEVYCKDRDDTLLIGSVMSNIGYGEAASGISAITKVLLAYHTGKLAANLHCDNPRQDIKALQSGRMKVVSEHQEFGRTYTAVNGISVTGVNAHVLLNGHYKPKDPTRYKCDIPRLVTISARQDVTVQNVLDDLKSRPIDPEEIALFHNIHQTRISGHLGRGYIILDTNEEGATVSLAEKSSYFDDATRPLWFVYSGMGSQWAGMGAQLMRIPVFAAAIERCRRVLEPKGVDIVHIITSPDKKIFDNILNSFVGIAAVQIGLTDVLTSMGIVPDNIIGHSVGELGCAYADGCFTAEEMILAAYSRGLVSVQTPFIKGSMAAVGIGYEEIIKLVPKEIEVACHNGPESSTISGPADVMKEFVGQLTAKGIFAKEVPCSNIAYHSRYIAEAGPGLLTLLSEVIKDPKPRSARWLSTSVPKDKWDEPAAKACSAQYHTNNLLNPVLFEETSRLIPANAVLIEIAPHGLLQAILKRSLPESCRHIPLTRRGHPDNALFLLDGIGKLYMEGYNPKVQNIYPQIQFPVSTGTPMLSHLVEWAHHEKWSLPLFASAHRKQAATCKYVVSYHDEENKYLQGHVIGGKTLYPFTAALLATWDTLAMSQYLNRREISVEFYDLHFYSQPPLHDRRALRLSVALHRGTGRFEILDDNQRIMTGFVSSTLRDDTRGFDAPFKPKGDLEIESDEVYQMFYERDHFYSGDFRSIHKINRSLTEAEIIWDDNWTTFLDGILQLNLLRCNHDGITQTQQIRRLVIDIEKHLGSNGVKVDGKVVKKAEVLPMDSITRCGGVLVENIKFKTIPRAVEENVELKALKFVPRFEKNVNLADALQVYIQTVSENLNKKVLNVMGLVNYEEDRIFDEAKNILENVYGVEVVYEQIQRDKVVAMKDHVNEVELVLVQDLSLDENLCQTLYRILPQNIFLVNIEQTTDDRIRPSALYKVISSLSANNEKFDLIKWRPSQPTPASTVVTLRSISELPMLVSTRNELPERHRLVILTSYPSVPGLKELVQEWRSEKEKNEVYVVMVSDKDYLDELPELNLAFNVLNDGIWGGEYYTPVMEKVQKEPQRHNVTLQSAQVGNLDSLHWVEAPETVGHGVPVNVHYAAVNDIDVKRAMGVIPFKDDNQNDTSYGMDFSGLTDSGKRVMGLLASGSLTSRVTAPPELLWPVPEHWSLEDAATVPAAYVFAYYCLAIKTKFDPNNKVLVHGGAGALGQAVISIALSLGGEVFTTVSDVRKKRFLMKLFPKLQEDHIGNSRDRTFGDMVKLLTKGKGVNLVISCVKGELKNVSIASLGSSGILIDVAQIPHRDDFSFGMFHLTMERNYMSIDLGSLFVEQNLHQMKRVQIMMSEGIARGYVRPLSRVTYSSENVSRAFKLLAASSHRGRVLINLELQPKTLERVTCSPEHTQLIICDESSLSAQLGERLVSRGARKMVLHCADVPVRMEMKIQSWQKQGVEVQVSTEDITSTNGVVSLVSESSNMSPVEGIFVVATDVTSSKSLDGLNSVIAGLDVISRKLCPNLKYFAVINSGITIGQQTCLSRKADGLPATVLNVPDLIKMNDKTYKNAMSWSSALIATEKAIRSEQPVLLAHTKKSSHKTLLEQIAAIGDIILPENVLVTSTLQDLGVGLSKVPAICSFLSNTHNVSLSEDVLLTLTLQQIHDLETSIAELPYPKVQGLSNYFQYVDPDELLATTEFVSLPTLTCNATMRDDEFDVSQKYLCIVPGMEGHYGRFQVLCERLKVPALVLQPGLDHSNESIRDTAHRYAKILLKKVQVKKDFYILGYESGVPMALEVASILEDNGLVGTVFCIGNTPEKFQQVLKSSLQEYETDEDLQDAVAKHMFTLMAGQTEGLDSVLKKAGSWKEKIEGCVRLLLGRVAHSAQYARSLINSAYVLLNRFRDYRIPQRKLRSKLILAAANLTNEDAENFQLYSQEPIAMHELKAPLAQTVQDLRCSAIVNSYLEKELIEAFEKKNLCETYLLNADAFMTNETEN